MLRYVASSTKHGKGLDMDVLERRRRERETAARYRNVNSTAGPIRKALTVFRRERQHAIACSRAGVGITIARDVGIDGSLAGCDVAAGATARHREGSNPIIAGGG